MVLLLHQLLGFSSPAIGIHKEGRHAEIQIAQNSVTVDQIDKDCIALITNCQKPLFRDEEGTETTFSRIIDLYQQFYLDYVASFSPLDIFTKSAGQKNLHWKAFRQVCNSDLFLYIYFLNFTYPFCIHVISP